MAKDGYSHYPEALKPASKETKEKQRAQRQRVRSKAAQAKARKVSKAQDKRDNISQAIDDVRSSDAFQVGAMVASRGRGGKGTPKKGGMMASTKENILIDTPPTARQIRLMNKHGIKAKTEYEAGRKLGHLGAPKRKYPYNYDPRSKK